MSEYDNLSRDLEELRGKDRALRLELERLQDAEPDPGRDERVSNLTKAVERKSAQIAEAEAELQAATADREKRMAAMQRALEAYPNLDGPMFEGPSYGTGTTRKDRDAVRDVALRCIDEHSDILAARAGDQLTRLVRNDSPRNELSKYISAVGSPKYDSAFGKMFADPNFGHLRFDREEVEAVRAVEEARAAMVTTSTGFPAPFDLDPSITLASDGVLNPVRQYARVITIGSPSWKGVTSTGVTASYDLEGSEVSDDTPALLQPSLTACTGRAFVQASIESFEDWPQLRAELARLISDARDVLDSTMFLSGTAVPQPSGVLTGLTTSQRIQTAGSAVYAVADVYSLIEALPPRFQPRAVFAASPTIWDATYRLTPSGSTTEPQIMVSRGDQLLGRPRFEWSSMSTVKTSAAKILLYGDFAAGYTIADRIGLSLEMVPHIVGSSAHLPLGVRGVFAHWRTGATVTTPNALRYLEVR